MTTTLTAKPVAAGDLDDIARSLAAAFVDDPLQTWLYPRRGGREARIYRSFRAVLRVCQRHGCVWTVDGISTMAWVPPEVDPLPLADLVRNGPSLLRASGLRTLTNLRGMAMIESRRPRRPHWYGVILGTADGHRGQGYGAAAMTAFTDASDASGVGAYIESSSTRNNPLYHRLGFTDVEVIELPKGPQLWTMWRDARPSGTQAAS